MPPNPPVPGLPPAGSIPAPGPPVPGVPDAGATPAPGDPVPGLPPGASGGAAGPPVDVTSLNLTNGTTEAQVNTTGLNGGWVPENESGECRLEGMGEPETPDGDYPYTRFGATLITITLPTASTRTQFVDLAGQGATATPLVSVAPPVPGIPPSSETGAPGAPLPAPDQPLASIWPSEGLRLIENTSGLILTGGSAFSGAALGPDGLNYMGPFRNDHPARYDRRNDTIETFNPPNWPTQGWAQCNTAARAANGDIYFGPSQLAKIPVYRSSTDVLTILDIPNAFPNGDDFGDPGHTRGICNGYHPTQERINVYLAPFALNAILEIDPETQAVAEITDPLLGNDATDPNEKYGGIKQWPQGSAWEYELLVAPDNCQHFLRYNLATSTATQLTSGWPKKANSQFSGLYYDPWNDRMIAVPDNADVIAIIDPALGGGFITNIDISALVPASSRFYGGVVVSSGHLIMFGRTGSDKHLVMDLLDDSVALIDNATMTAIGPETYGGSITQDGRVVASIGSSEPHTWTPPRRPAGFDYKDDFCQGVWNQGF